MLKMRKEEKIREILMINEDEYWEETLKLASELISITEGGDTIFKISEKKLTFREKILLYMLGKKYSYEARISNEPFITLDELTRDLNANRNAISARVSELVRESKLKYLEKSKYQLAFFDIKKLLDEIISKYI